MNRARLTRWRWWLVLLGGVLAGIASATGQAHADPSDTPCYRGAIYCPPPYYGGGNAPCQYVLGHWVTAFGRDCATGSAFRRGGATPADCVDWWHVCAPGNPEGKPAACFDAGGVITALWPCRPTLPPGPAQ